ncbi:hypothetical protein V9T40_010250 [Parthenolecanium corni]|uniref:Anaphase-promoting complex subunit 2 n=1 Tax=Parthenolecanium corni TaxID=536013 RepID=A0AAN9T8G4_9HEMI
MMESKSLDDLIWFSLLKEFPLLNTQLVQLSPTKVLSFNDLKKVLHEQDLIKFVCELVFLEIEKDNRQNVVPNFTKNFQGKTEPLEGFRKFQESVKHLYCSVGKILPSLNKLEELKAEMKTDSSIFGSKSVIEYYKMNLIGTVLFDLPEGYTNVIKHFYCVSFKAFCNCSYPATGSQIIICSEHHGESQCNCINILRAFDCVNKVLSEIGLLEKLIGSTLTKLVEKWTQIHVDKTCRGAFDTSNIKIIERWIKDVVLVWLTRIYRAGKIHSKRREVVLDKAVTTFREKLLHFVYETYEKLLIDQLFNIIIEYPDSYNAIEDLRICLQRNNLQHLLIEKTKESFVTRLLHPGVNTPDILTAYVASIHALQHLDPSGMLLDAITSPISCYLRSRDDTVHCIVTSLTEEGATDLSDELSGCKKITLCDVVTSVEDDMENWESWVPDPVEVVPGNGEKRDHSTDIITMLVNVFGSKQLFIDEYCKLLADRFLTQFTYNTDKEIRNLELLKLRFGDSELHKCEVMLKDIHDSVRIGTHLQSDSSYGIQDLEFSVRGMFLSAQFWPPFKDNTLKLPTVVTEHLDVYTKAFETYKGNRTLLWKSHLGIVTLEIELKDRTLNLTVSPVHATIIWHFQTKSEWSLADLSKIMMTSCSVLRRKISFWQSQGVLIETAADQYMVLEESSSLNCKPRPSMPLSMFYEEDEAESAVASAQDQRNEELQVFWSYIVGMLTNLESLTLERIHQMLKMFASHGSATKEVSPQQLKSFLDKKVKEHLLIVSGGFYKLAK